MRPLALPLVLASLTTLACAKPAVEQGSTGSVGDPLDHEQGPDDAPDDADQSSEFASAEPRPVDAPAPGSCPASKVREVRYGGTVDKRVELPAKIAGLRCVNDLQTKLEADIACAQAFNEASWGHALYEQGLALIEAEPAQVWIEGAEYRGALEYGSIQPHPEEPGRHIVFFGLDGGSNCGGPSAHTQVGPGIQLARNRAGEVVVVMPMPTVEARSYARCSCDPGCGAMMEPTPIFVVLPEGTQVGETVELVYPAISISSHSVENQSCCCAP